MDANENTVIDQQLELVVLEGKKRGATVALEYGRATTVGVGYDCDVVLDIPQPQNPSMSKTASTVELLYAENQLSLKVLQGSVMADGRNIETDDELPLAIGASVQMQNHVFEVRPTGHVSYTSESISNSKQPDYAMQPQEALVAAPKQQYKRFLAGAAQSIAGIAVLGGSFWAYTNIETPEPVTINDVVSDVESDLQTGGFGELDVVLHEDNTIAINGYLQNRSDLQEARQHVQIPDLVQWDVKLGDSLAESVGSVYRVNGIDAEIAVLGEGAVSVNTATSDLELLQRVEESAYQDVADLRELKSVNEPPEIEVEEPPPQRIDSLPGKRIVMIVASEPKYIQTEDGSRYFENSILPSGHTIVAILDKKVQLLLDEKQVELSF